MKRIIQITGLAQQGFGNQLFRYAFARGYAEALGAVLETPPWIGQKLFDLRDPPISCQLPKTRHDHVPWGEVNVDLQGFFQFCPALAFYSRRKVRQWFTWRPEILAQYPRLPGWYAAMHVRRGDYQVYSNWFCLVSESSYIRVLQREGISPEKTVRVSDGLSVARPPLESLSFVPDFLTLMRANVLLRGNSTFSWWAATLGHAETIYAPLVQDAIGPTDVDFVTGNWPRLADTTRTGARLTDLWLAEE